jgi:hypothetical protein
VTSPRPPGVAVMAVAAASVVVEACAATATPSSPPMPGSREATPAEATTSPATATPSASGSASDESGALAAELEIRSIDPSLTGSVLAFASDGESVLFSSGRADDAGRDAAPDLWRYTPGPDPGPHLVWRNPDRDHSIVGLGGDLGMLAWVSTPTTGERAWDLWLLPRDAREPFRIDSHPGDFDVSSLVPSFSVYENTIVWTAFDAGASGPVSQLLTASAPDWMPRVIAERRAEEAELWHPSLYGSQLAYVEVRYADDRASDERYVYLQQVGAPASDARRLDTSGRATMPLSVDGAVLWKEADPGFNMFNWGRMFRHDIASGETMPLGTWPQDYVNYPSAGARFVAWWGADSFQFGVYDLRDGHPRLIERYAEATQESVVRPHVAGDLLVWLYVDTDAPGGSYGEIRYAFLPPMKELEP